MECSPLQLVIKKNEIVIIEATNLKQKISWDHIKPVAAAIVRYSVSNAVAGRSVIYIGIDE